MYQRSQALAENLLKFFNHIKFGIREKYFCATIFWIQLVNIFTKHVRIIGRYRPRVSFLCLKYFSFLIFIIICLNDNYQTIKTDAPTATFNWWFIKEVNVQVSTLWTRAIICIPFRYKKDRVLCASNCFSTAFTSLPLLFSF